LDEDAEHNEHAEPAKLNEAAEHSVHAEPAELAELAEHAEPAEHAEHDAALLPMMSILSPLSTMS